MTPEERREFLREHRLAVIGVERRDAPPQLSPVYYVMDGDDLLISTTAMRAKTKVVRRTSRVSVCVLGERRPFPYITIYGCGRIEAEGAVEVMAAVTEKMTRKRLSESARSALKKRARREQRVVLRVTPESFFPSASRGR